jgi:hypothetical protein
MSCTYRSCQFLKVSSPSPKGLDVEGDLVFVRSRGDGEGLIGDAEGMVE